MQKRAIPGIDFSVSVIGIGGHYRAIEEGDFEQRYAYVDWDVEYRTPIIEKAFAAGINYYDTTWRNEVDMLGKVLARLGIRDKVFVNGMVLGAFSGSKASGQTPVQYFNKWLNQRLLMVPGNRFDSLMINAIEEDFDEVECENLVRLLEQRQKDGDFRIFGFSCHNVFHARKVLDKFPEFRIVMIPYNFRNRAFELAFKDYVGNATFIAMKPLVWMEYGIPFCALNSLDKFEQLFGFPPDIYASARALKFITNNPAITTAVCAVNSIDEVDAVISAGEGGYSVQDQLVLSMYNELQTIDDSIPLYVAARGYANLRMNYFSALHLSKKLGLVMPNIPLNQKDSFLMISEYAASLDEVLKKGGYGRYLP